MTEKVIILYCLYYKDNIDYVKESINSILNQEYSNFLLFINVDGKLNSPLQSFLKDFESDDRIKIKYNDTNRGLATRLNEGVDFALNNNFEYIARMDADDVCMPDRLSKQISFLADHSEFDILGTCAILIDNNGELNMPTTHEECLKNYIVKSPMIHPSVIFRPSFFSKAGKYNKSFRQGQDYELWFRGFKNNCKFANLSEPLIHHRIDSEFFKSRRSGKKRAKMLFNVRNQAIKELNLNKINYAFSILIYFYSYAPIFMKKFIYSIFR